VAPVWLGHNQQLAGLGKQLEARAEALKRGIAEVRALPYLGPYLGPYLAPI